MKADIVRWCKQASKKFRLKVEYLSEKDIYRFTKNGHAVMSFHTDNFYSMPRKMRERHIEPMIRMGLTLNLGEKDHMDRYMKRHGKKIC